MPDDQRDLLQVLKRELEFLREGEYHSSARNPWRPQFVFEDSPSCLNRGVQENRLPCSACVLMELVPPEQRDTKVPCRHIPLTGAGETIDYFYRWGTQQELEEALEKWLQMTIHQMEEERAKVRRSG